MKKMITVMILCIVSAGASAGHGGRRRRNRMERTEQVLSRSCRPALPTPTPRVTAS
jgi:hypothetical protein